MNKRAKITGAILAGGLARRMNQQDKGLVLYQGQPLVSYAIAALTPLVDEILINANRHLEQYVQFGLPVIKDQTDSFDGPLAGMLSAMLNTDAEILLMMPCDAPLMTTHCLQKLLLTRAKTDADIAVAFDGERLHPVFLAIHSRVRENLQNYLATGQRKVQSWLTQHHFVTVDLSDTPEVLSNLNTFSELFILAYKKRREYSPRLG